MKCTYKKYIKAWFNSGQQGMFIECQTDSGIDEDTNFKV